MTFWLCIGEAFSLCTPPQWLDPKTTPPPLTEYNSFYSPTIGQDASYLIYLPPGYDLTEDTNYPVLYWLHGGVGGQVLGSNFVLKLEDSINRGVSPEFIVVLPHGPEMRWIDSNPGQTPYDAPIESVVINDLIPHIDATYRTIPTRQARGVEGFSVGGRGASGFGLKYPDKFGLVSGLASAFQDLSFFQNSSSGVYNCVFGNDANYFNENDPFALAAQNADLIKSLIPYHFRIVVGDLDIGHGTYQTNLDFDAHLSGLGIRHTLVIVPGVGHSYQELYNVQGDSMFTFFDDAWGDLDTVPPSIPTGLTGNATSARRIKLGWTASTDDVGITGYNVFRNGLLIATVTTNTINDKGRQHSTIYTYTVSSLDAAGNESAQSASITVRTKDR